MSVTNPISIKGSLRTPTMEITVYSGDEGPTWDPYSYREFLVTRGEEKILLHLGLGDFLKVNGTPQPLPKDSNEVSLFQELTGLTPTQIEKYIYRKWDKCTCGCRKPEIQPGYPGESFLICPECNTILETFFNESAII